MASGLYLWTWGKNTMEQQTAFAGVTSEATGFDVENVIDNNPDTYWKGTSTADQEIDFDFGSGNTITPEGLFIFVKNYTSLTGSETVECLYSSDDVSYTNHELAGSVTSFPLVLTSTPLRVYDFSTSAVARRYFRIKFTNITTIPEIAMIGLSLKQSITIGNSYPEDDAVSYMNQYNKSIGGRELVRGLNKKSQEIFTRKYLFNGTTNWNALLEAFNDCYGRRFPLVYSGDNTTANAQLVRFADDKLSENQIAYQLYNPTIRFKELPYIDDGESY